MKDLTPCPSERDGSCPGRDSVDVSYDLLKTKLRGGFGEQCFINESIGPARSGDTVFAAFSIINLGFPRNQRPG